MSVCLAQCTAGACASDPLLSCQSPGAGGKLGFTVPGNPDPAGTTYCSARPCKTDGDCGLTSSCDAAQGGFCVAGP